MFYQPPSRSEACIVHAANLPSFRVIELMEQNGDSQTEGSQDDSSQTDADLVEVGYDSDFRGLHHGKNSEALCEMYHVALML